MSAISGFPYDPPMHIFLRTGGKQVSEKRHKGEERGEEVGDGAFEYLLLRYRELEKTCR
jgi:hypothetical protein